VDGPLWTEGITLRKKCFRPYKVHIFHQFVRPYVSWDFENESVGIGYANSWGSLAAHVYFSKVPRPLKRPQSPITLKSVPRLQILNFLEISKCDLFWLSISIYVPCLNRFNHSKVKIKYSAQTWGKSLSCLHMSISLAPPLAK